MTRRELLAWLGLAACGPPRGPVEGTSGGSAIRSKPRRDASSEPAEHLVPIADDFSNSHTTQYEASPLLVRGELVARRTKEELQFLDARSLKVTDHVTERYRSACVWKETLFGFAQPDNGPCEIDVFERTTLSRSMPLAGCTGIEGVYMVVAGSSTLFVTNERGRMTRYQLKNNALEDETSIPLEKGADPAQGIGLDDGRLLLTANKALQTYGGSAPVSYPAPSNPAHLCAGTNGRVWYSTKNNHVLDQIILAKLDTSLVTEATIAVTPARITHMASGADGSLAVMTTVAGQTGWIWTLILLDPKGAEKKRIVIDDEVAAQINVDLNAAFVALTPTTIVIDAVRPGLFGWNAATGARI